MAWGWVVLSPGLGERMREGGPLARPIDAYVPELAPAFERHGVRLAILYGSQARGNAGPLSDVDVGVLFEPDLDRRARWDRRLDLLGELQRGFGRADAYVADLAGVPPLLCHEVWREGRLLYAASGTEPVEFGVGVLRDYADTAPLRRMQREALLARIERAELGHYPERRRSMVNAEVIVNRLGYIDEYLARLQEMASLSRDEFTGDVVNRAASERELEQVIQLALHIGSYILAADFPQRPHRWREVFLLLGRVEILPEGLAERLAGLADFRNGLLYLYEPVDADQVYEHVQRDPDDVRQFARHIVAYLRRSGALEE